MAENSLHNQDAEAQRLALPKDLDDAQPAAWKEIENGRYQPRRIKGSCLGRELG